MYLDIVLTMYIDVLRFNDREVWLFKFIWDYSICSFCLDYNGSCWNYHFFETSEISSIETLPHLKRRNVIL